MKNIALLFCFIVMLWSCKKEPENNSINDEATSEIVEEIKDSIMDIEPIEPVKTAKQIKEDLMARGFKTFDYVDEKTNDTILMQQYFIAFLKSGPIRGQNEEETAELQEQHLAHLGKMYELGYSDLSGPFGDNGNIRGITIYNVPTFKMADSLANADPMVKAGRLEIEIHPWWAAKGFALR